jgi:two-component sensor histidine kinase
MKVPLILRRILISSWFLAAIPAVFILIFLPPLSTKYTLNPEPVPDGYSSIVFKDLNSDNITEVIMTGKGVPYYHYIIMDNKFHIFDQFNLKDNLDPDLSDFSFGNYDNDKFEEIYIFSYKDDSLFLNINEYFEPGGLLLERQFISKIGNVNGKVTSSVWPAGFFDVDGDGKKEFYFSIVTGFGLEPRRAFYFNISSKKLKTSPFTGTIIQQLNFKDSDEDSKPEIFGLVSASGNYKTNPPFSDYSSWMMVLDENLNFEFPPVEFPGFTNRLTVNSYSTANFKGFLVLHNTSSADTSILKPQIMEYSVKGQFEKNRLLSDFGLGISTQLIIISDKNRERVFLTDGELIELNDKLEAIKRNKAPFHSDYRCYSEDLNFDGTNELLLYSQVEEKLVIYDVNLNELCEAEIKAEISSIRFSSFCSDAGVKKLFLASVNHGYFLKMENNSYYYLGFLAYPGIYFLFFLFILLVRRINTWQVVHSESLKRRLVTLQLRGIRSQLDPHFTFNALNSIASLIYLEDRKTAYDYMNKFTQLLRSLLNDAERIYRSLSEELEFTITYLELEKLRFGEKFSYLIEIGEGVSRKEQVPKLVLHTFAENAIKHGIMPLDKDGVLKIRIDRESDFLKIIIEDNGVGRKRAEKNNVSTGRGLTLTNEFYDILNQINKRPIRHLLTDLYDSSGSPAGTRVEVWVPVEEV